MPSQVTTIVMLADCLYYYFFLLSAKYIHSALKFKFMHKFNRHFCNEMLHHIASTLSDNVSTEVIVKYFVCCLTIILVKS